ncbi:MAG: restriction endonuclease [Candidatus Altiarchaeota archaeon]|nr:restriction endonuclease [Candidatus Altiarchaeota archaeon]
MDPDDSDSRRRNRVDFPEFPKKTREWEDWEPLDINEKKLKSVLRSVLKESGLELDELQKVYEGEWKASAVNRLGNRVMIVAWTKYMASVGLEDVEDLYEGMLEVRAHHAVFITTSHFTREAQKFAEHLPIELVDDVRLGELVPEAEIYEVEAVFVTEKGDREAMDYFKTRRKRKLFGLVGEEENIEYVDRRYLPYAVYTLGKPKRAQEEESKKLFVDLSTADIPYIEERELRSANILRRIMELPGDSREHLLDLIQYRGLSLKHVEGKHLEILERKGLVVSPASKSGEKSIIQIIGDELSDTMNVFAKNVSNIPQPRESKIDYTRFEHPWTVSDVRGRQRVRANIRIPQVDRPFDLEHFLDTSLEVNEKFDADKPRYNVVELRNVLERLYNKKVEFKKIVYMPYYLCKYTTIYTTRYLRYISPSFNKEIFPPKTAEYGVYEFIDKHPAIPYVILGMAIFLMNLQRMEETLHLFSSISILVAVSLIVGVLLKAIFRTPRKVPRYGGSPIKYGFPSIHSMLSVGGMAFTFFVNPMFLIILTPLTLLYIYSRIALGVHNTGDVLGGAFIGLILGIVCGILVYQQLNLPMEVDAFFTLLFFILPLFYNRWEHASV